jgi:hypothetical protein
MGSNKIKLYYVQFALSIRSTAKVLKRKSDSLSESDATVTGDLVDSSRLHLIPLILMASLIALKDASSSVRSSSMITIFSFASSSLFDLLEHSLCGTASAISKENLSLVGILDFWQDFSNIHVMLPVGNLRLKEERSSIDLRRTTLFHVSFFIDAS